jgi:hypothetical protein
MSTYLQDFDEICLNCGKRYGEHYGREAAICSKFDYGSDREYIGTYFASSGTFCSIKGKIHHHVIKKTADPNMIFKGKRGI